MVSTYYADTWREWTTTSATVTTTATSDPWIYWTTNSTASTTTDFVWTAWSGSPTARIVRYPEYYASATETWRTWATVTTSDLTGAENRIIQYNNQIYGKWVEDEVKERRSREEAAARRGNVNVAVREQQRQEALREQQEAQQRLAKARKRRVALERSELLLLQACNDEQKDQFEKEKSIIVTGKSGTRYKITNRGTIANVHVLREDGKVSHRLCAHPRMPVPQGDVMLAQKLMLEYDEEGFINLANRHLA